MSKQLPIPTIPEVRKYINKLNRTIGSDWTLTKAYKGYYLFFEVDIEELKVPVIFKGSTLKVKTLMSTIMHGKSAIPL